MWQAATVVITARCASLTFTPRSTNIKLLYRNIIIIIIIIRFVKRQNVKRLPWRIRTRRRQRLNKRQQCVRRRFARRLSSWSLCCSWSFCGFSVRQLWISFRDWNEWCYDPRNSIFQQLSWTAESCVTVCFSLLSSEVTILSVNISQGSVATCWKCGELFMAALRIADADIILFPRLILAVADWMSTILPLMVWP